MKKYYFKYSNSNSNSEFTYPPPQWIKYTLDLNDTLTTQEEELIKKILGNVFDRIRFLDNDEEKFIEIKPHDNFKSPWCSNVLSLLKNLKLDSKITRIEKSFLYPFIKNQNTIKYDPMLEESILISINKYDSYSNKNNLPVNLFSDININDNTEYTDKNSSHIPINALNKFNDKEQLGLDEWDIDYYKTMYEELGRDPTKVEIFDLAQANSEHSRHWFFRGSFFCDNNLMANPMRLVKRPHLNSISCLSDLYNSLIAFSDNSSAIKGYSNFYLSQDKGKYIQDYQHRCLTFTAETHNFPTGICPFPGAATGTGGRIRDNQSIGRGGFLCAATAGYCVGKIDLDNPMKNYNPSDNGGVEEPMKILIEASNGASDYGNKFGEPLIQGFTRSCGVKVRKWTPLKEFCLDKDYYEWKKPIMFSGGMGWIMNQHLRKYKPKWGMLIVRLGGPAYKIGIGGGAASSRDNSSKHEKQNFNAVQRGDPEMENKMNRVIRTCIELGSKNPILSIHDQGAGGMANSIQEIMEPNGGKVFLSHIILGDESMTDLEIWISEHQEQNTCLVDIKDICRLRKICRTENCPVAVVGYITNSRKIQVFSRKNKKQLVVDLPLNKILGKMPPKKYELEPNLLDINNRKNCYGKFISHFNKFLFQETKSIASAINENGTKPDLPEENLVFNSILEKVFKDISIGSKRFLTNKVDRSVTGLVAQQQCVGPLQTPLSNVAVIAGDYFNIEGGAMAIGEQPLKGLIDPVSMARMAVGEMLTNLVWAPWSNFNDIKCSGNWMWPMKYPGEKEKMYLAAHALSNVLEELGPGIAIDGGKDSLSMAVKMKDKVVKSPGNLVISGYVTCPNITKTITPDLKGKFRDSKSSTFLLYLDLGRGHYRMGGSILGKLAGCIEDKCPNLEHPEWFRKNLELINRIIERRVPSPSNPNEYLEILSGHDRSDGGLITTIFEMAMAGNVGVKIDMYIENYYMRDLTNTLDIMDIYRLLFSEELGIVIEVPKEQVDDFFTVFDEDYLFLIGETLLDIANIELNVDDCNVISTTLNSIRELWEYPSYQLEKQQCELNCVESEQRFLRKAQKYSRINLDKLYCKLSDSFPVFDSPFAEKFPNNRKHFVALLREEGSNGDKEMAAAFYKVGFEVIDLTTKELLNHPPQFLDKFRGLVMVGGFSYADVLGAGKAWYLHLTQGKGKSSHLERFKNRPDTFTLGVCNGCQLMSHLNYLDTTFSMEKNVSGRFESRFSILKINETPAIMLKNMDNSSLGCWIAHGEGRFNFSVPPSEKTISLQYLNHDEQTAGTKDYPFNPNGSPEGIAALCSKDGRHLAMMPHPERSFKYWQWPCGTPEKVRRGDSPWIQMFRNAYEWCDKN